MEGCASFLLDWLIEGPEGTLETNPSTSPEHMFIAPNGKPASVSYSSTMDMQIIAEVFSNIVSAAEVNISANYLMNLNIDLHTLSHVIRVPTLNVGTGQK